MQQPATVLSSPIRDPKDLAFLNSNAEDLRIGEVAILLQEYKKLIIENERLKAELLLHRG